MMGAAKPPVGETNHEDGNLSVFTMGPELWHWSEIHELTRGALLSTPTVALDLAEASGVELAEFAQRHGVAVEQLERCQTYLRTSAPERAKFELLSLMREPEGDAVPRLVLRVVRDNGPWVELPTK